MPNLCPGNEEFQYKKPFADATFLVCETQTVSGLEIAMLLFVFSAPCLCFLIGQDGRER